MCTRPPSKPGEIVHVRQRQYLVEEVTPPTEAGDATLVRLSCLDDDAQGQELEVLWEAELDGEVLTGTGWDHLANRGFDPPRLFSAYLHTLRWNCVTATNPRLFQSPFRAGIRIDAYQIEPLRKALLLPRVNLFIADDVGLGKTIEAGLIARELLLRKKVRDIVVACPPSVLPPMAGRAGAALRPWLRDPRQGLHHPRPPRARLRRQSLGDPHALPDLAPPADRRGVYRAAARLARRLPARLAADPRRGPPRRPVQRLALRHRLEDHPGRPRPGPAVRAPAVPLGHAAQRALEQLLGLAGDPRPAALLPRRSRQGQEAARRRHGPPTQGGHPRGARRLPQARSSSRSTSTACRPTRPSCGCRSSSTSTASSARNASRASPNASRPPRLCSCRACSSACSPPSRRSPGPCACIAAQFERQHQQDAAQAAARPGLFDLLGGGSTATTTARSWMSRCWSERKKRRFEAATLASADPLPTTTSCARSTR